MSLVFVAAEAGEFNGILRHASGVKKLAWPVQFARSAELGGREVTLVANGPGPKLAAAAAKEAIKRLEKVEAFISTGFCGALEQEMHACDIFVATHVNGEESLEPKVAIEHVSGPLVSQDTVACTVEEKQRLRKKAKAVEMEAAGVAQVARDANAPFYCVRVVTDGASDRMPLDFNRMRAADGRFSRGRILVAASRHPGRVFPGLMKLQRTCKSASIALGDFIAHCRF